MNVLVAALLYVPGIVVGAFFWKRLSRRDASLRYSAAAIAVSLSAFLAAQCFISFVIASYTPDKDCLETADCQLQNLAETLRWWFLGLALIFNALAYLGAKYCARTASRT